jgi:hypothetical protein
MQSSVSRLLQFLLLSHQLQERCHLLQQSWQMRHHFGSASGANQRQRKINIHRPVFGLRIDRSRRSSVGGAKDYAA